MLLPRDAMLEQYILLSCLSVTSRSSTKMAKPRIARATPYDSPGSPVFWCQSSERNSNGVTPNWGAKYV